MIGPAMTPTSSTDEDATRNRAAGSDTADYLTFMPAATSII
jgi:hypothetical protein